MSKFGPKAQLAAVTHHWGKYFTQAAQQVLDGTWKSTSTWGGIKEGMAAIEGFGPAVPDDVKKLVAEKQAEIVAGTLAPFAATITDNQGKVQLEAGGMDEAGLNKQNHTVQGVGGK